MNKNYNSRQKKIYSDYRDYSFEKLSEILSSNKYNGEVIEIIQDILNERKTLNNDYKKPNSLVENDLPIVPEANIFNKNETIFQQSNEMNKTGISLTTLIIVNLIGFILVGLIVAKVVNEDWSFQMLILIVVVGGIMTAISKNYKSKGELIQNFAVVEDIGNEDREQISTSCKVIFHRDKNFLGMAVPLFVYINGNKIGEVNNGKSIEFTTNMKSNTISVTDHLGNAFKDAYKFDAVESGIIEVHFNRKFK